MQNDLKHCTLSDLVYNDLSAKIKKDICKMGYTNVRFLDIDGAHAYICKCDTQISKKTYMLCRLFSLPS